MGGVQSSPNLAHMCPIPIHTPTLGGVSRGNPLENHPSQPPHPPPPPPCMYFGSILVMVAQEWLHTQGHVLDAHGVSYLGSLVAPYVSEI